jgi:hypothetical protein
MRVSAGQIDCLAQRAQLAIDQDLKSVADDPGTRCLSSLTVKCFRKNSMCKRWPRRVLRAAIAMCRPGFSSSVGATFTWMKRSHYS